MSPTTLLHPTHTASPTLLLPSSTNTHSQVDETTPHTLVPSFLLNPQQQLAANCQKVHKWSEGCCWERKEENVQKRASTFWTNEGCCWERRKGKCPKKVSAFWAQKDGENGSFFGPLVVSETQRRIFCKWRKLKSLKVYNIFYLGQCFFSMISLIV